MTIITCSFTQIIDVNQNCAEWSFAAIIIAGGVNNLFNQTVNQIKTVNPALVKGVLKTDKWFWCAAMAAYMSNRLVFLPNIQLQWLINAIEHTALSYGLTAQNCGIQLPNNDEIRQKLLDKVLIQWESFFSSQTFYRFCHKVCATASAPPLPILTGRITMC